MLKIRLQKIGKKNAPSYRIALVEHTTSPQGKFIEILGTYNPRMKKKNFKKERIEYWLTKGAQASPTVHNLLVDEKIIDREKLMAWKPKKREGEAKPVTPEAPKTEPAASQPTADKQAGPPQSEGLGEESKPKVPLDTEPKKE
jgi:small subunit ribosomal protein S16